MKNHKINLSEISKGTNDFKVDIVDIIEDVPINEIFKIPNCCGAYIITVKSGKRYVGTAKKLQERIPQHKHLNDKNFEGEKIDKVSAYLTKTLYDADILETLLIRELEPKLNKRHQDDASTWKEISREQLLSNTNKELKEIFDKLSKKILTFPRAKEVHRKSGWTTYQISAGKNFCILWIKKDYLIIDLKVDKNNFKDPDNLSSEIEWTTSQAFNRRIEMYDDKQFEGVFNLIKQSYECICKK